MIAFVFSVTWPLVSDGPGHTRRYWGSVSTPHVTDFGENELSEKSCLLLIIYTNYGKYDLPVSC